MIFSIRSLVHLLTLTLLCTTAFAQMPKVGNFYRDTSDLGFRVKVPDGWKLIPPSGDDQNLIAKFDPQVNNYVQIGSNPQDPAGRVFLNCWLLKFDRRPEPEAPKTGMAKFAGKPEKDIAAWLKKNVEQGSKLKLDVEKAFKCDKIEAIEYQFTTTPPDMKNSARYYACLYKLKPDIDVALIFSAPGDPKKWNKWETPFDAMSRSFGVEELKAVAGGTATGTTYRDKRRAEINTKLATQPGWKLYESSNYFVVTPHTDRAFVQELLQRLEAIHAIYVIDYPAAKAEEYKKIGEAARTGEESPEEKARKKSEEEFFNEGVDSKELATCSIVRVFTDEGAYHSYGGPPSSAGYWSPVAKELVIYDDQAGGGRNDTWLVLNHEAFHQYIFYFYGSISPHSWYNEGTGDYYSGYFWKNGKFILKENSWRKTTIAGNVREDNYCPLDVFVRWDQRQYYGTNDLQLGGGENYAQGWSLIYFLRTGKKNNAKGWDPAWDAILETYLRVLAMSGKLDQAVDEAFKGIDMRALENAWKDYTR
ncbi:MAG: hypothetical protein SGI72_01445 [Planctomycetota bacterium]|nr:hypothetical protein [Planctomycetota bacterium]